MPGVDGAPSLIRRIADIERDLRRLLQAVRGLATEVPFSYPGALTVSTSPPWTPRVTTTLTEVRCLLGTAGTSSTVVTVYKNGTSVGTVTLTSGQTNVAGTFSTSFTADTDLLTFGVTTVGTGAANLTALARVT